MITIAGQAVLCDTENLIYIVRAVDKENYVARRLAYSFASF